MIRFQSSADATPVDWQPMQLNIPVPLFEKPGCGQVVLPLIVDVRLIASCAGLHLLYTDHDIVFATHTIVHRSVALEMTVHS